MNISFFILLFLFFLLFVSIGMRWWAEYLDWFVLHAVADPKMKRVLNEPSYPFWLAAIRSVVASLAFAFFLGILPLVGEFPSQTLILFDFFAVIVGSFLGAMFWFFTSYLIDKRWHRRLGHRGARERICYVVEHGHLSAKQFHLVSSALWGAIILLLCVSLIIWVPLTITA